MSNQAKRGTQAHKREAPKRFYHVSIRLNDEHAPLMPREWGTAVMKMCNIEVYNSPYPYEDNNGMLRVRLRDRDEDGVTKQAGFVLPLAHIDVALFSEQDGWAEHEDDLRVLAALGISI